MSYLKLTLRPPKQAGNWIGKCLICSKDIYETYYHYLDNINQWYCVKCGPEIMLKHEHLRLRGEEIKIQKDRLVMEDKRYTMKLELQRKTLELEQERTKTLKPLILDLLIRDKIPPKELAQLVEAYMK